MNSDIIEPDYIIELNPDYTISNHGIHKHVCSYYRKVIFKNKNKNDSVQDGGFIRGGIIFPKNSRKYFTPSALRYLQKYNLSPNDILSTITSSYNPEYYNSNKTRDLNEYMHIGGKQREPIMSDILFKEDYSGDKIDKRLVYLMSISNKSIVVKISQAKNNYVTEKRIYQYFNDRAMVNKSSKKYDSIIDKYVSKTYETRDYPEEYLYNSTPDTDSEPHILLPCKINNKKFSIKLSNRTVPTTYDGYPFITTEFSIGVYNNLKEESRKKNINVRDDKLCLYMVLENRPKFTILKDYVTGEADPDILKRLVYKTSNILKYLNQFYNFNHWDLHYSNLLVYVSPKNNQEINSKRKVEICIFDLDLAAIGNKKDTNVDAYLKRLKRYITPNHNLLNSFKKLLYGKQTTNNPSMSPYIQQVFELFENFLSNSTYTSYNLDKELNKITKLELYFKYMGRIHDIIRLVNNINASLSITEKDVHKKYSKSTHTDENKTNIEVIIIYNLMKYMNLKNHKRMAYATLMYTDFFLYLRKDKVLRNTILKL